MTPEEIVTGIYNVLGEHVVDPDGRCSCGAPVNTIGAKGKNRAALLNRHRAYVLYAAGYRRAAEVDGRTATVF